MNSVLSFIPGKAAEGAAPLVPVGEADGLEGTALEPVFEVDLARPVSHHRSSTRSRRMTEEIPEEESEFASKRLRRFGMFEGILLVKEQVPFKLQMQKTLRLPFLRFQENFFHPAYSA